MLQLHWRRYKAPTKSRKRLGRKGGAGEEGWGPTDPQHQFQKLMEREVDPLFEAGTLTWKPYLLLVILASSGRLVLTVAYLLEYATLVELEDGV